MLAAGETRLLRGVQEQRALGAALAQAVGLDMAAWWKPTAEGYFKHVSKAVILDAVGAFAPEHVTRLAKLKKADIASEAERLAEGAPMVVETGHRLPLAGTGFTLTARPDRIDLADRGVDARRLVDQPADDHGGRVFGGDRRHRVEPT